MELTQERLKEVLHYDAETGLFTWKVQPAKQIKVGSTAGSNVRGYIAIRLEYKTYRAHRLAFLYMTGEFPGRGLQVDHIDHVRDNNRWNNLRIVTQQDNQRNASLGKNNTSGVVGVHWYKRDKVWVSSICINGKLKQLGSFKDIHEAIAARKAAEKKYGFHANHGKPKPRMINVTVIPS